MYEVRLKSSGTVTTEEIHVYFIIYNKIHSIPFKIMSSAFCSNTAFLQLFFMFWDSVCVSVAMTKRRFLSLDLIFGDKKCHKMPNLVTRTDEEEWRLYLWLKNSRDFSSLWGWALSCCSCQSPQRRSFAPNIFSQSTENRRVEVNIDCGMSSRGWYRKCWKNDVTLYFAWWRCRWKNAA